MSPAGLASAMMLASGAAHAVVNAIFKSGRDKMASRALIDAVSGVLVIPAVLILPLPDRAWAWLAGSVGCHLVYLLALIRAFEGADMMVAYPVLRGIAPALAALAAVAVFGEPITPAVAAGVALVSGGVAATALGRHMDGRTLAAALACGGAIAAYTVIDAQGVRAAPSAPSYIAWSFLLDGGVLAAGFALWRGKVFLEAARGQWRPGLAAGALSIVSYGLALWAFRLGPTPRLAALRETSILFAVAIAVVFLKEKPTFGRLAGVALAAGGAAVLVAAG